MKVITQIKYLFSKKLKNKLNCDFNKCPRLSKQDCKGRYLSLDNPKVCILKCYDYEENKCNKQ